MMERLLRWLCLLFLILPTEAALARPDTRETPEGLYAVRYGTSRFPAKHVFPKGRGTVDFGWYVFVIRDSQGWHLIDCGPARQRPEVPFPIDQPKTVRQLLEQIGCRKVESILLTHGHWDHAGGLQDFPQARVFLSQTEWDSMHGALSDLSASWNLGYRRADLAVLEELRLQGRLQLFARPVQVTSNLKAIEVGGHTPGMVALHYTPSNGHPLVLVGDNAYLYQNMRRPSKGLRAIQAWADQATLIPGHDPQLIERYPAVAPSIVRLDQGPK